MKAKLLKRILFAALAGTAVFCMTACGGTDGSEGTAADPAEESTDSQETEETADTEPADSTKDDGESRGGEGSALIAYFSWSGNTEAVAREIQSQTGADLFEIVPEEPYTEDYDELLDIAREEQSSDARPAIADTVDLFPNWWGDMPMILYTFLDDYDLSGKTIAPFNTSGGSGFSGSLDTIEEMEPEAELTEGLSLGSSEAENCTEAVSQWLEEIGMAQ